MWPKNAPAVHARAALGLQRVRAAARRPCRARRARRRRGRRARASSPCRGRPTCTRGRARCASVKPAAVTSGAIRRISQGSCTSISSTAAAQLCSGSRRVARQASSSRSRRRRPRAGRPGAARGGPRRARSSHSGMWHSDVWKTTASKPSSGEVERRARRRPRSRSEVAGELARPLDEQRRRVDAGDARHARQRGQVAADRAGAAADLQHARRRRAGRGRRCTPRASRAARGSAARSSSTSARRSCRSGRPRRSSRRRPAWLDLLFSEDDAPAPQSIPATAAAGGCRRTRASGSASASAAA